MDWDRYHCQIPVNITTTPIYTTLSLLLHVWYYCTQKCTGIWIIFPMNIAISSLKHNNVWIINISKVLLHKWNVYGTIGIYIYIRRCSYRIQNVLHFNNISVYFAVHVRLLSNMASDWLVAKPWLKKVVDLTKIRRPHGRQRWPHQTGSQCNPEVHGIRWHIPPGT